MILAELAASRAFDLLRRVLQILLQLLLSLWIGTAPAGAQRGLDDLWQGRAHFEQVRELNYGGVRPDGSPEVIAAWYAVAGGRWYAFGRSAISPRPAYCPYDHTNVVVAESADKGRSWSKTVVAVSPGASNSGDACAILDGSSFYDRGSGTWHMLAQCMDRNDTGGWSLCHYTRRAASPMGRFVADPANPVVRGGQLWSRICAGADKFCPAGVFDEGTPEIVDKVNGRFVVTLHGFDGSNAYRTVVATPDFRTWSVAGDGLPDDAILTKAECSRWLTGCVGFGEGTAVRFGGHIYIVAEAMNRSLLCKEDQTWRFAFLRSKQRTWPKSGQGQWEFFRSNPLLQPSHIDPKTPCQVNYAKWLIDGPATYLIYEDWDPKYKHLHRRLLKVVPGGGPAVVLH